MFPSHDRVGGQKKLPKELQEAILKAPAKMLSKSGIKMMDKSPAKMKAPMKKQKSKSTDAHGNVTKTTVKGNKKKEVTRVKREYASNAKPLAENPTVKRKAIPFTDSFYWRGERELTEFYNQEGKNE